MTAHEQAPSIPEATLPGLYRTRLEETADVQNQFGNTCIALRRIAAHRLHHDGIQIRWDGDPRLCVPAWWQHLRRDNGVGQIQGRRIAAAERFGVGQQLIEHNT